MLDRVGTQSILFLRLSAVGDVVNTLPAIAAARAAFPRARIGYLVEDKAAELVVGHPDLDEVFVFPKRAWRGRALAPATWKAAVRHVRGIREGRFDVLLDLQGNLKGGLHAALSGVPTRVGFARGHCRDGSYVFTNVHVTPSSARMLRARKFLELLRPLGVDSPGIVWRLPPRDASARSVGDFLESIGLRAGGYVLMHPGTSARGREKRWSTDRFAALARAFDEQLDLRVLIAWGPGERALAEEIAHGSRAIVAMETRSLLDLAELLSRARLFVGADSGPLHLASSVETPSVALFGPKDPAVYAPCNPRSRVVRKSDEHGRATMSAIETADALEAARSLLDEERATPPGGGRDRAQTARLA